MSYTRLTILILALAWVTSDAAAQFHTSKVSVPDDLVVRQYLSRALDALEQGDTERAIRFWQDVLDRLPGKVVETHRGPRSGTETDAVVLDDRFEGVRIRVMNRIRTLPERGLELYQKLMEPKARELLTRGVATEDEAVLRRCVIRFFLTPSGRAAYLSLVDLLIEHGRFDEARLATQRLRSQLQDLNDTDPIQAQAAAREAVALWGSGNVDGLRRLRSELGDMGTVTVNSDRVDVSAFVDGLLRRTTATRPTAPPTQPALGVFRSRVWFRPFNRNLNTASESIIFVNGPRTLMVNHYPVVPTIHNGVLYFCDGRSIKARSLFTGSDVWPGIPSPLHDFSGRRNRNLHYHVTVDRDLVFGYLQGLPVMEGQRAWQGFQPIETIPCNKLVAVDVNTGEVRWSHLNFSGRPPDETEFLRRLDINQPPLVVGDTIYVAGSVLLGVFHQWVCAFERDTGKLRWKTYTGAGQQELNMFGNPVKEAVPGHLTEADGVLYYSTNIGVACAIDSVTGTPLWESAYDQERIPTTDSPVTRERHPGWMPSSPVVWNDKVFMAPTDSLDLIAADRKTGKLTRVLLAKRTLASRNHYFLGIHDGKLLVAGSRITAIDPVDYSRVWQTVELAGRWDKGSVQGRPAVSGTDLVFTSTARTGRATEVSRVDLRTGRFVEQETLRFSSREGNLVLSPDAMVIAGEESIHTYFDLKAVEQRLARAGRMGAIDPELQMRLGDVRQRQGQWGQSLEAYGQALKQANSMGPRARHVAQRAALALYNGWLEMAHAPERTLLGGPSGAEDRFHRALTYARTESQRVRALIECMNWALAANNQPAFARTVRLLIDKHAAEWVPLKGEVHGLLPELEGSIRMPSGLLASLASAAQAEQVGRFRDAVEHYHDVQGRWPEVPLGRASAWRLAGNRIRKIIKAHGRGVYRRQETAAKKLLAQATGKGDLQAIRTVLRRYPQSTVVETAYLALSRSLLDSGRFREALGEMQRYFTRFGKASAAARLEYARCLDRLGATDSALQVMQGLDLHFSNEVVKSANDPVRVRAWVKRMLAEERYSRLTRSNDLQSVARNGRVAWKKTSNRGADDASLVIPQGRGPEGTEKFVLVHIGREVLAVAAKSGDVKWRKPSVAEPHFASWHDGHLVMALDADVVSLDATSGSEQWRMRPEGGDVRDLACGHGKVYILLSSVVRGGLVLSGLDITSGEEVQSTSLRGYYSGSLSISPTYVLVRANRQYKALCFDGLTGESVGAPIGFHRDGPLPFLSDKDQVVMVFGSRRRSREKVRVLARDPEQGKNAWEYDAGRGTFIALTAEEGCLVFELRMPAAASGSRGRTNHKLVVLDLAKGAPRFVAQLERNEFSTDAVLSGKRLYLSLMASVKTGTGIAQKVRAYDMLKGTSPWATTEFPGANISLWVYPTAEHLLLRKSMSIRSRRPGTGDADELYLIDRNNGKVVDLVGLGKNTEGMREGAGMVVRDGTLVITSGGEVKGWVR